MPLTAPPYYCCQDLIVHFNATQHPSSTVTEKVGREGREGVDPISQFHCSVTVMVTTLVEDEFYTNG